MEKIVNNAFQLLQSARRSGVFISVDDNQLSIKYSKENNIEPHLLEEIKNNKALIIDFLNEKKSKLTKAVVYNNQIRRIPKDSTQPLPLSFSQERLWFIDRLEGSVQYHVPAVWRLQGELNKEALSRALHDIVQRHEVLRTVILEEQGQAFQFIMDTEGWQLAMIDGLLYREDKERLQQYIQDSIREPFDLSKDYMLRASLITLSDQEHVLIVTTHHIASDGWSTSILVNEVMELYNAYDEDRPARLAPLPIQYCDYALWERDYLQGEILDKKVGYWKDMLKGVAVLQLPTDHQRPSEWTNRGALLRFGIDKLLSDQLQVSSKRAGTTLFMTMLAAFKILLHRYSGQEDICVGSPIANRTHEEIEGLIGFFVNTLALRSEVKAESSFTELLKQVKVTTMEAYEHQDVPFEKVVEAVVKERDLSRSPLFQVMFSLLNTPEVSQLHLGEVELSGESYENLTAQFDISFNITETAAGLLGSVQYSTDLYNESTIVRMMDHFITLLNSIVKAPEQKIGELAMLTKEEEQQLLVDFNDTVVDYPKDKTIVDLFEEQALKTPEGIAIIFEEKQLNYQQLNEKANQLAHYLRSKGVKEETLVPICIERSMEMIVGILGILKAGGAYVPIDPEYPEERISYMLEDTGAALVVSSKESRSKLKDSTDIEIIELDGDWITLNYQLPTTNDQRVSQPHHLAYVIYTSGSTGSPKGVMIEHASLINYVLAFTDYFSICSKDVIIQQASISFDTSAEEIYPALIAGGCICLIKEGGKDIDTLKKYIENDVATILTATPRLIDWLNKELVNTGKLRYLISGGEALNSSNINNLFSQVSIANGYGPSEATIAVIFKKIDDIFQASVIGKPFANTAIYILGTNNNLSPVGVAGEICIGGAGLARGYLNRPDLTKEKFVPDPFNNKPGARMYKTGDLGRWLADGNIEYIGREDNQVKIRGYRIELGEIENTLQQCDGVSQGIVVAREDSSGNKRLIGYVVPQGVYDKEAIVTYLRNVLPDYMVPALWVELEKLPITPNGKIDKKALPDFNAQEILYESYVAPRNETEKALTEIWEKVLKVEKVGINSNFFELGGHSLMILKLVSQVRKLGLQIDVKEFFKFQTIEQQSTFLTTSLKLINAAGEGKYIIPIQPKGTNIPLFAFTEFLLYSKVGEYIGKHQPFYSIERSPYETKDEIAAHYISEIKKIYPHGPYCLAGFCKWGDIAVEMAQRLVSQGEEVPLLILIEYYSSQALRSRLSPKFLGPKIKYFFNTLRETNSYKEKGKLIVGEIVNVSQFIYDKLIGKYNDNGVDKKTYSGKVVLVKASDTYEFYNNCNMGWSETFIGEIENITIEGDHLNIMRNPAAAQLAEKLNAVLEKTNEKYNGKVG